ncbi:hypothetical protein KDH10_000095 [Shewanella vesiculosa]|uniref:hypothetical protein n=1 Tax=Shewanella vesiculosa TaxID=518738 RepID=UPI001404B328|nr:hypothetical protein [Shewanella vesiculosa]UJL42925.1 hypothetical protein KDH10_000095 [Shewanella vesiculosa]
MAFKLIQLFLSSFGVILLGILLSKYTANYYPFEYVGYLGTVKAYSVFLSNVFLLGLNYSFFFLIKNSSENEAVTDVYQKSINLIFLVFLLFLLVPICYFYFNKAVVSSHEVAIVSIAFFCALVLSVCSVLAKRDAYNNDYGRFFIYTSSNNIILLLFALLGSFLYTGMLVFIFVLLLIIFILAFFSFKSLKLAPCLDFAKKSMSYAKFFYLHLFLSTGFLAFIQFVLNSKSMSTEFNALITIFSLLNVATVVVGNYIFPKLVANSESEGHLFLSELTAICVLLASFFILFFFDFGVRIIFKENFIQLTIISVFLLQSKVLEISSGILGYKLSSKLQFKKIYVGFALYCLPTLVGLALLYYDLVTLNTFCLSILIGWALHYLYIVIVSYSSQKLRGTFVFLSLILGLSIQYYFLIDLVQGFTL